MEALLWLLLIVPGVIYSAWRLHARREACAMCGAGALLPLDSPRGHELADKAGFTTRQTTTIPTRGPSKHAYRIGRKLGSIFRRR